jgi:large subunit ribosomal protein L29
VTILHPDELRDMTPPERQAELEDLETELLNAEAVKAAGGMPENPARIKEMRRTIARIKTIQREEGDDETDVDDAAVAETETITGGIFGRSSEEEEADEAAAEAAESDEATADEADSDEATAAETAAAGTDGGDDSTGEDA